VSASAITRNACAPINARARAVNSANRTTRTPLTCGAGDRLCDERKMKFLRALPFVFAGFVVSTAGCGWVVDECQDGAEDCSGERPRTCQKGAVSPTGWVQLESCARDARHCVTEGGRAFCALSTQKTAECVSTHVCLGGKPTTCFMGYATGQSVCDQGRHCFVTPHSDTLCVFSDTPDPACSTKKQRVCLAAQIIDCHDGYRSGAQSCAHCFTDATESNRDDYCAFTEERDPRCADAGIYCDGKVAVVCRNGRATERRDCSDSSCSVTNSSGCESGNPKGVEYPR
jgi:hypothetical protein